MLWRIYTLLPSANTRQPALDMSVISNMLVSQSAYTPGYRAWARRVRLSINSTLGIVAFPGEGGGGAAKRQQVLRPAGPNACDAHPLKIGSISKSCLQRSPPRSTHLARCRTAPLRLPGHSFLAAASDGAAERARQKRASSSSISSSRLPPDKAGTHKN